MSDHAKTLRAHALWLRRGNLVDGSGVCEQAALACEAGAEALERRKAVEDDIDFLARRAMHAGCCSFREDRDFGISSNSLVAIAYGLKAPWQQELPVDGSDLAACERAVARLPGHRRTPVVLAALDRARKEVRR